MKSFYSIYADASGCSQGKVFAYSFNLSCNGKQRLFSGICPEWVHTIYDAEIHAILKGIMEIGDRSPAYVCIHSDCQQGIKAIKTGRNNSQVKIIREILKKFDGWMIFHILAHTNGNSISEKTHSKVDREARSLLRKHLKQ